MSEKNGNNWEKFLTGDQDRESPSNSPVTSIKPSQTPASTTPAEAKKPAGAPETLEEKIARVMAGINMPKKTVTPSASKAKTTTVPTAPVVVKAEEKLPGSGAVSKSSSNRTTPVEDNMANKVPAKLSPPDIEVTSTLAAPVVSKKSTTPEPEPVVKEPVVKEPVVEKQRSSLTQNEGVKVSDANPSSSSEDIKIDVFVKDEDPVDDDEYGAFVSGMNVICTYEIREYVSLLIDFLSL
jgi:hypothetical protein